MQHVAIDGLDAEMLERAGHRLRDLPRQWRPRVVRQAMVLPALIGELRLHEDVFSAQRPSLQLSPQRASDRGFPVMPTLVRCVNPAKPRPERLPNDVREHPEVVAAYLGEEAPEAEAEAERLEAELEKTAG